MDGYEEPHLWEGFIFLWQFCFVRVHMTLLAFRIALSLRFTVGGSRSNLGDSVKWLPDISVAFRNWTGFS